MERIPKFLRTNPMIYGLSFYEIGALVLALHIAMILHLSSFHSLIICLGFIIVIKFIKKNFDLKGYLSKKSNQIDLTQFKGGRR